MTENDQKVGPKALKKIEIAMPKHYLRKMERIGASFLEKTKMRDFYMRDLLSITPIKLTCHRKEENFLTVVVKLQTSSFTGYNCRERST